LSFEKAGVKNYDTGFFNKKEVMNWQRCLGKNGSLQSQSIPEIVSDDVAGLEIPADPIEEKF
jgi:hypothetical protein